MRKRIAALLLVAFSLAIFAGCSPTANQYFDEYQKVAAWNGTESTSNMDLSFAANGQTFRVPVKVVSEATTKDGVPQLAHAKVSFGDLNIPEMGNKKLPDFDIYMDMRDVNHIEYYLSKASVKEYIDLMGPADDPSLKAYFDNISADYVKVDLASPATGMIIDPDVLTNGTGFIKELLAHLYKDVDVPVDMKKDGDTYSLKLDEKDVVALVKATVNGYAKNKAQVNADLTKIYGPELMKQITPELDEVVNSLNENELNQDLKELEQSMKGSYLDIKETFNKDMYQSEMAMGLNLNFDNQPVAVNLKLNSQNKRNDKLSITLPKNAAQLNFDDLYLGNILVTVDGQPVHFADQQPVIQNDRTLVPYRAIAEATGAKVEWNNETRTVTVDKNGKKVSLKIDDKTAKVDGKDVALDVPASIMNSRTMVPLRFVGESLGYKVEWYGDAQLVTLNKIA